MVRFAFALACALSAVFLLLPQAARACSSCGCGDPTLTSLGTEKPYAGRVRAAISVQARTDAVGRPGVDELSLRELRTDAHLAIAPHERLFVQLSVPTVLRSLRLPNDAHHQSFGLGDAELRLKPFVYQDRAFSPSHLVSLLGGVKLPTALRQRDAEGALMPLEVQPGTGSLDLMLGAAYAWFSPPWSAYASVTLFAPTLAREELRPGASVRGSVALQRQLWPALAVRLGLDARVDDKTREHGERVRDSAGAILFTSPELVFAPASDWMLALALRVPTVNALRGYHREGALLAFTVARDF